jgi:putative lipoic acid-binding regulatory protein
MAAEEAPSLIEYPSLFPIKVMGVNDPGLEQAVVDIALQFDPGYDRATLELRPSSGG